jgi:hypothetical protein
VDGTARTHSLTRSLARSQSSTCPDRRRAQCPRADPWPLHAAATVHSARVHRSIDRPEQSIFFQGNSRLPAQPNGCPAGPSCLLELTRPPPLRPGLALRAFRWRAKQFQRRSEPAELRRIRAIQGAPASHLLAYAAARAPRLSRGGAYPRRIARDTGARSQNSPRCAVAAAPRHGHTATRPHGDTRCSRCWCDGLRDSTGPAPPSRQPSRRTLGAHARSLTDF